MTNINYAEIMRGHYDEIVDKMIEMDIETRPYQMDLYIYPDGRLYEYTNVGGNSWLDDEHYVVWKIDNQHSRERDDMSAEEVRAMCEDSREFYESCLEQAIEEAERDHKDYVERYGEQ